MGVSKEKIHGFTLVELMIVVAIVAILAAIALQGYAMYVSRSQVVAGLDEIRGGKMGVELALNEGHAADVDAAYIGLQASTPRCSTTTALLSATGEGSISCTLRGNDGVAGRDIRLLRSASGYWACDAGGLPASYRPDGCS
ncbi:pilin [Xanthomonas sp. SI]|uniref:pilin n=1 Tax=Xanthomonas sp. SI TaxID=2724123 RepID=UPI001639B7C6|nr:pilin [Xanthomonas sp. SI]